MVNDGDMYLWRELGINSWPTFAIVGPNGKLLAQIAGEGRRKVLMTIFKIFKCAYNPFCSRSDYFFSELYFKPMCTAGYSCS